MKATIKHKEKAEAEEKKNGRGRESEIECTLTKIEKKRAGKIEVEKQECLK